MRALNEIVDSNRAAVAAGVIKDGDAVGTGKLYDVYHNGKRIKHAVTLAQCADIRDIQNQCSFLALN